MTEHLGDALSALADGQLDHPDEAAALDHLAGCRPCAEELASVTAVRSLVRALPPVEPRLPLVDAPPLVDVPLLVGTPAFAGAPPPVDAPVAGRHPGRLAGMLATAAASVALLLLSGVQQESGTGPQVAQLVRVHTTSPVNTDPMSQVAPAALPVSFSE